MSRHVKLLPDLQQLIDDFVSVRQRFADLAEAYVKQKIQLQKQQIEIENGKKEIFSLKQIQIDKDHLSKSYDQLKRDYDILYSSSDKQREEIYKENDKRFQDLEEQLKAQRLKLIEQAETHKKNMSQIVLDYNSKLRDADAKIRRLSIGSRDDDASVEVKKINCDDGADDSPASKKAKQGVKEKWPELPLVRYNPKPSSSRRGRGGRARGTAAKRKLYVSRNDEPVDIV